MQTKSFRVACDEILFKQPESSHLGDCPICFLPMPLDTRKCVMMTCCSKMICGGCHHASFLHDRGATIQHRCQFCRILLDDDFEDRKIYFRDEELDRLKRVEACDPVAMRELGTKLAIEGGS